MSEKLNPKNPIDNLSPMTKTCIDIISGFAAGSARVLIGNPFDLVKVRMQT